MIKRRSIFVKYFIGALFGAALYSEWFVYRVQPLYWPDLQCDTRDPSCTKVLFIADPQIQGDYEFPPPWNYIFEWDADRYLKATFSVVVRHFRPDVLVYLGDLMDEGSISTMQQYHQYAKRLAAIFDVGYPVVQIWVPGDNDIGGEGEPVYKDKVKEFKQVFNQPDVINFRNISFYKVNGITHEFPSVSHDDLKYDNMRIVVSHYTVTEMSIFGEKINIEIQPHMYFSAHDHDSKITTRDSKFEHRLTSPYKYGDAPLEINVKKRDKIYEITVPTCSYRMGTDKIGFGAAVIGHKTQHMKYTVFWSPSRYPFLFMYLVFLLLAVAYFSTMVSKLIKLACSKIFLPEKKYSNQFRNIAYEKV